MTADATRSAYNKEGAVAVFKPGPRSKLEKNFEESLRMLAELGALQCSKVEAAAVLGVSEVSLHRFMRAYPEADEAFFYGSERGRASLRRTQWLQAQRSPAMAIWLGKQWLGQRDKHDVAVTEIPHEEALRALG